MDRAGPLSAATHQHRRSWIVPACLAALILALCLGLTFRLWHQAADNASVQARAEFDLRAREITNQLALRINSYVQVLRGVQALFISSDRVTRREFATFVMAQDLRAEVPGLHALGYIEALPGAQARAHVARVRAEGHPAYAITPPGERDQYAPVTYLASLSGQNQRAFGYDAWSEPVRRRALETARDSGQAAMSGRLLLVEDSGANSGASFQLVLPVYLNRVQLSTLAQRRAAIRGWIVAPLRARDLIASLPAELAAGLDIELYDGDAASDAARMYTGVETALHRPVVMRAEKRIGIGVHRWTLAIGALPGFGARVKQDEPAVILAVGVAGSVILALLTGMLAWSSGQAGAARAAAQQLAAGLDAGRQRQLALADAAERAQVMLRSIVDSALDGILVDDGERQVLLSNQRFLAMWAIPAGMDIAGNARALTAHMVSLLVHPAPFLHSQAMQDSGGAAQRDLLRLHDGRFYEQFTRVMPLAGGRHARLWSFRDITERKQIEQRERAHRHVLELLARGAPLQGILEAVVLGVEASNPGMLCSIMLLTADGRRLVVGAAPSLPAFFNQAVDNCEIGPQAGSCGAAAWRGARVVVEDIQNHPDWADYREAAARAKLVSCWSQPIRGGSGRIIGSFAIYHRSAHYPSPANVVLIEQAAQLASIAVEQAQAAQALRAGEDRFRSLYDHAPVALWQQDWSPLAAELARLREQGVDDIGAWLREQPGQAARLARLVRIADVNTAALSHVGAVAKDLTALSLAQNFDLGDASCFIEAVQALAGGARFFSSDSSFLRLDGSRRQHALTLLVMPGHARALDFVIVSTVDITERKRMGAELQQMAATDFLTGLPNRREFMARIDDQLARLQRDLGESAAVLMLDIDHFKKVNDQHGHACGDAVLRRLADVLRASQRKIDTPGRIGGEEFALLLPGADLEDAAAYAERLRQNVAGTPFECEGGPLAITVSIGIAAILARDASADAALNRADKALYKAKRAGRNRVGTGVPGAVV